MSKQEPKSQKKSIVFLGNFNTMIFQPAWFASEGLIKKQEAEDATIHIIHPDVTNFSLEWLEFNATNERVQFLTKQEPYYYIIRDLAVGTFKILRHTPIRAMGINHDEHYPYETIEEWHSFGHKLAPKKIWEKFLENPGMRSLAIEGKRTDGHKGYILVRAEPSKIVQQGILISVNDHFEIPENNEKFGCDEIINILETSWNDSIEKANNIIKSLLGEI